MRWRVRRGLLSRRWWAEPIDGPWHTARTFPTHAEALAYAIEQAEAERLTDG